MAELIIIKKEFLTTAEILYFMPDYAHILQTYLWQDYDVLPNLPKLQEFIHFWEDELDGPLHSVRVSVADKGKINNIGFIDTFH